MLLLLLACREAVVPTPPMTPAPTMPASHPTADTATNPPLVGSVEVGTGESSFLPLVDNAEVPIVYGPQGGYHMIGAVRACDLEPPFDFRFQILRPSGELLSESSFSGQVFTDPDGDCTARFNLFGFLELTGPELDGEAMVFQATFTDSLGEQRQDSRPVLGRFTP